MEAAVTGPEQADLASKNRRPARKDILRQTDKPTRTRTGCTNCRKRHRKCDEVKPTCLNCRQRKETCSWSARISFKAGNSKHLGAEHPSMKSAINPKRHSLQFEMVKIPGSNPQAAEQSTPDSQDRDMSNDDAADTNIPFSDYGSEKSSGTSQQVPPIISSPKCMSPSDARLSQSTTPTLEDTLQHFADESMTGLDTSSLSSGGLQSIHDGCSLSAETPNSRSTEFQTINTPGASSSIHIRDAAADLLALRFQTGDTHMDQSGTMSDTLGIHTGRRINDEDIPNLAALHDADFSAMNEDIFGLDDGLFIPGSAYEELHTTLRKHIIHTARSNVPSRIPSPSFQNLVEGLDTNPTTSTCQETLESDLDSSNSVPNVSPHQEYILWKNWVDEVAPWLDKFDNKRHFEHKIPMLAKATPHLKYSTLALSARQMERKDPSKPSSQSFALYQHAIHLLLPELQTKVTTVIASCVILCVLEMMSCSPKAWRRHLDGCANLLEAVGINGFRGGLDEALFWCFVRMDVCCGLISQEETIIPIRHWASNIDLTEDIKLFRNPTNPFDKYASYAVYLCARVLELSVANSHSQQNYDRRDSSKEIVYNYTADWSRLFGLLENWFEERPEEMKPILVIPATTKDHKSPFPIVLYGNGPSVSGNQMYHTASLLMLQMKPKEITLRTQGRSILWHARQICAISESNTHHGSWTNSIQPLWIAGKVMSHPSEHKAVLGIYSRIERETGWATSWRAEDLREYWGNLDAC